MSNRRDFTKMIIQLLQEMVNAGDEPIGDYWLRSAEEQKRLFDAGLSKKDGTVNLSQHQLGKALDIYLVSNNAGYPVVEYDWDEAKSEKWHKRWEEMGGRPLIVFSDGTKDHGHFEVD